MIGKAIEALNVKVNQNWVQWRYLNAAKTHFEHFKASATNSIPIFAFDRGGSTWFTDLLLRIPNTTKIDDPTYLGYYQTNGVMPQAWESKLKELAMLNFYYYQPIPPGSDWPEALKFFQDLFNRRIWHPLIVQETELAEINQTERFVYKINNGHLFLSWLCEHFEMQPVLFLRHPCAVVASQMRFYVFEKILADPHFVVPEGFRNKAVYDQYANILKNIKYPEEALAAQWCINFRETAMHPHNNRSWITMTYERLLVEKESEMMRLFEPLNIDPPDEFFDTFYQPINTEKSDAAHYRDPSNQLAQWKERLSSEQLNRIWNMLDAFEIKAYGAGLEPDYALIYHS